jgi:hypothetical protein
MTVLGHFRKPEPYRLPSPTLPRRPENEGPGVPPNSLENLRIGQKNPTNLARTRPVSLEILNSALLREHPWFSKWQIASRYDRLVDKSDADRY